MKITTSKTHANVRRWIDIKDGPVLVSDNSSVGRKYRVEKICISYTWKDGIFVVDSTFDIKLVGPFLKKDGSDSRAITEGRPPYTAWHNRAPELAWLRYLVEQHRPTNDFSMTVLTQHPVENPA